MFWVAGAVVLDKSSSQKNRGVGVVVLLPKERRISHGWVGAFVSNLKQVDEFDFRGPLRHSIYGYEEYISSYLSLNEYMIVHITHHVTSRLSTRTLEDTV